jgi:superfamily I DNA/RNA helicase
VALYQAGGFVESLGAAVSSLAPRSGRLPAQERRFTEALQIYWRFLHEALRQDGLVRFAELFARYSERHIENFAEVPSAVLRSMSHVLIDEFQDISPEIVGWIRGTLLALRDRGIKASLLCVGDDSQSIYGWRGSSPDFILGYEEHFPTRDVHRLGMRYNFRSTQQIIDVAEAVLTDIPDESKIAKHGLSRVAEALQRTSFVRFVAHEDLSHVVGCVRTLIARWQRECGGVGQVPGSAPIKVLTRRGGAARDIRQRLARLPRRDHALVGVLTFHGSKGLEADYCVLVGDCLGDADAPFREFVYTRAGFEQTYREAQREEALRLAYVAMTRARKGFVWYAEPRPGGAFALAAASVCAPVEADRRTG